jgi:hypothetical protein
LRGVGKKIGGMWMSEVGGGRDEEASWWVVGLDAVMR